MTENKNKKIKIVLLVVAVLAVAGLSAFFLGKQWFASSYFKQAQVAFLKGDYDAAKGLLEKSLKFNAKNPEPHFYLAEIALGKPAEGGPLLYPHADYESAVRHFEQSLSLGISEKNKEAYLSTLNDLSFSYQMLEDYDKAVPLFLKYIELNPDRAFRARVLVATDYFDRFNKPQEALDILLPAVNSAYHPSQIKNLFRVYSLLGRLYSYFADADNTEKYAKLAIANSGGLKEVDVQTAHTLLAHVAASKGDWAKVESEIAAVRELSGSEPHCAPAGIYHTGKAYQRAIDAALKAKPSKSYLYSICLQALGESYLALGNKSEAKKYFEEYLSLTDTFKTKNIFVFRNREKFADFLK